MVYDPSDALTCSATFLCTLGYPFMLTSSMLKVDGSDSTLSHSILVGLERLTVVFLWGDVIVRAFFMSVFCFMFPVFWFLFSAFW